MAYSRREFLKALSAAGMMGALGVGEQACGLTRSGSRSLETGEPGAPRAKPNVVLIVSDDQGYGDVRCYQELHKPSADCDVKTPHIDSLARNGVLLTDFYAHPVCTPSRFCLLTGLHLGRSKDLRDIVVLDFDYPEQGLREPTVAELFRDNGYGTSIIGKWHLGSGSMVREGIPPVRPHSRDNPFHPNEHGFDYFYGFLGGSIDYCTHEKRGAFFDWFENKDLLFIDGGSGNNIHEDHGKYSTHLITSKTVERINHYADAGKPFFIEVAYNAPHWAQAIEITSLSASQLPNEEDDPSSPFYRRYLKQFDDIYPGGDKTNWRKRLLAMVKAMDEGIGEILQTLHKRKLVENTIVVFISDNGGEILFGDWLASIVHYGSSNYPFTRAAKGTLYEGGVRVPAIIQWKGHIPCGRISRQIASVVDLKLTLAHIAGLNTRSCRTDGIDLSPNLLTPSRIIERDFFYYSGHYGRVYRRGKWKYLRRNRKDSARRDELYDVKADPAESNNLAGLNPEKVQELKVLHAAKLESVLNGAAPFADQG